MNNSRNKIFGILAIFGGTLSLILAALIWAKIIQLPLEDFSYYPRSSFKIPEDVLKERIATVSAQTYRIPIIMYHYVQAVDREKDPSRANLAISPYFLEKQIESLKNSGYTFLFVKDIPNIISHKIPVPPKPVALTFDDGYEDFYWNALPLLKKYNIHGTLYIIVNFVGRKDYLTLRQLEEIRDSGLVEIAPHTFNHAYLKDMKVDTARKEIFESKARLESMLNIKTETFAYPYGAFSKETLQITQAAGFSAGVSVIPGVSQDENNIYYLYRLRPGFLALPNPAKTLENYRQTAQK